jgi:tRNA pseudouridine32 synthase/23S rRNA pseudouridine746 synthase/23S rRNA pseudouridine1911/1915/1917 synthase
MKFIAEKELPLLDLLKLHYPDSSKNTLRSFLEQERVQVSGRVVKHGNRVVSKGQTVTVGKNVQFLDQEVRLFYEDEHLVVVYKPEGLLSVATDFDKKANLHSILKRRKKGLTVYPVQRLDRETSGVMVFAYSEAAKEHLKSQFKAHSVEREYVAIVEGILSEKQGRWESHLLEDSKYFVRSLGPNLGKLSITHYKVLKEGKNVSLLRFSLETGRKNQIRVHTSEAGHPVVGDMKYGAIANPIKRLCLHARKLRFVHPVTNRPLAFEIPLPEEFYQII